MNLFPYMSSIALSCAFEKLLSPVFILNLMQLIVHPSLEIIPCLIAFFFSYPISTSLGSTQICQNRLCLKLNSLQTSLPVSL